MWHLSIIRLSKTHKKNGEIQRYGDELRPGSRLNRRCRHFQSGSLQFGEKGTVTKTQLGGQTERTEGPDLPLPAAALRGGKGGRCGVSPELF